jgi:uncharacterized protein YnzC (UPF0291/DUF896 family)
MLPAKQEKGIMQMVLDKGSNRQIVRTFGKASMTDVIRSKLPTLGRLIENYGAEKTENVIAVLLKEASGYFGDAMPDGQALEVATEITVRYKWLKMEDVFVAMNELKEQNIYGKLTPNKILNAINKYSENRLNYAAELSLNAHLSQKESRDNEFARAEWLEQFRKDVAKHNGEQTVKAGKDKPVNGITIESMNESKSKT